jgi:polyhydroxyalkanoate synthesis repressor PhaR
MSDTVVLKKYANRRLYDTEKSAYVTLNEVADYIRQGRQVQILDAKSRENVTAFTLTQIVLEQAKNNNALLPEAVLHMIIRYGDNLLGEFFEKYFVQTFQNFVVHKQSVDKQFQQWLEMGMNMSKNAQQGFSTMNPLQPFFKAFDSSTAKRDEEE